MSIKKIHLRKLLMAFGLPDNKLTSVLRSDIRDGIAKESGEKEGGGDFHVPFWSDAKEFVLEGANLEQLTASRVYANPRRRRLYPALLKGFMSWWNNKKRFSNERIEPFPTTMKSRVNIDDLGAVVKVENLLGVSVGSSDKRIIYPYFAENPSLSEQNARLGLWLISQAFPNHRIEDFRILDVLRGHTFSIEDLPLTGTERQDFTFRFKQIVEKWEKLKGEY